MVDVVILNFRVLRFSKGLGSASPSALVSSRQASPRLASRLSPLASPHSLPSRLSPWSGLGAALAQLQGSSNSACDEVSEVSHSVRNLPGAAVVRISLIYEVLLTLSPPPRTKCPRVSGRGFPPWDGVNQVNQVNQVNHLNQENPHIL